MQPIGYDPGIFGFVKAHRHRSGSALVLSIFEEESYDVAVVYWTKRLHHNARPYSAHAFVLEDDRTMKAVERTYEIEKEYGPPTVALCDHQRDRVYAWENATIYPLFPKLTWIGCKRFLNRVWRDVGEGSPLELTNKRKFINAISLSGLIHLPVGDRFFWRKPLILHEIAHELNPDAQHGPQFVRTYLGLLDRYLGLPKQNLMETARSYGIDF